MKYIILITGLSGSGKTSLSRAIINKLDNSTLFNADDVRKRYNDWSFSSLGRKRQCERMKLLASQCDEKIVICDFIAPTKKIRNEFNADFIVWMDTVTNSIYKDTDKLYEIPTNYDLRVSSKDALYWTSIIVNTIFDNKKE